jgi:hypothetical protein
MDGSTVLLDARTDVPGRPFTALERTGADLAAVAAMRAALAARLASAAGAGTWEERGEAHLLVAARPEALIRPALAVGFFSEAREIDHGPILHLEYALLDRVDAIDGFVSYHNVRFADGRWGNLVTFDDDGAPTSVRDHPIHREALALTATHYRTVRLHRLRLADGAAGSADPELRETLLFDFDESPPWRAVRPA